jgi:hypothetical protein
MKGLVAAILNMAQTQPSWIFWAKIREDLANFPGIYGCLASRKVNLELLLTKPAT